MSQILQPVLYMDDNGFEIRSMTANCTIRSLGEPFNTVVNSAVESGHNVEIARFERLRDVSHIDLLFTNYYGPGYPGSGTVVAIASSPNTTTPNFASSTLPYADPDFSILGGIRIYFPQGVFAYGTSRLYIPIGGFNQKWLEMVANHFHEEDADRWTVTFTVGSDYASPSPSGAFELFRSTALAAVDTSGLASDMLDAITNANIAATEAVRIANEANARSTANAQAIDSAAFGNYVAI